jgi:zinc protease
MKYFFNIITGAILIMTAHISTAREKTYGDKIAENVSKSGGKDGLIKFVNEHQFSKNKTVRKYMFSNGLTVLSLADKSAPVFSYQTWFKVGSRNEKKGKTGIAHLFEHLMFKGTKNYPHGVFDRILEENGAQTNAATWLDWTYYYENLPAGKVELSAALESDRMTNLILTKEQLESERDVVKNERRYRVENDPDGKMYEELFAASFLKHPYGMPTIGFMEDLDALTLENCLSFYSVYYSPTNAIIVVVGDFDEQETLKIIAQKYGSLKQAEIPPEKKIKEPLQKAERRKILNLPIASEKAKIGYKIPYGLHRDVAALDILNEILFNNESSRLYLKLVVEMETAISVSGWASGLSQDGILMISLTMKEGKKVSEAEKVIDDELKKVSEQGVTGAELAKAKNKLEADMIRSLFSAGSKASQLGMFEASWGDYREFFKTLKKYQNISNENIKYSVKKYLSPEKKTIIIGVPSGAKQ